jgi:hypothetical protein
MNGTDEFKQRAVSVDQHSFIAPLEEMASPFFASVDPASVSKKEILQTARQRDIAGLEDKMDRVGHEAEGMHPIAETASAFLQEE